MDRCNTSHPRSYWRDIYNVIQQDGRKDCRKFEFFCYFAIVWAIDDTKLLQWKILLIVDENKHEPMSCVGNSRIEKAVSFRGCTPVGAKALDDIGFTPMGAVDRSWRCAPRLNAPQVWTLLHWRELSLWITPASLLVKWALVHLTAQLVTKTLCGAHHWMVTSCESSAVLQRSFVVLCDPLRSFWGSFALPLLMPFMETVISSELKHSHIIVQTPLLTLYNCISDVVNWSSSRQLQLKTSKTEVIWFSSWHTLKQVPETD